MVQKTAIKLRKEANETLALLEQLPLAFSNGWLERIKRHFSIKCTRVNEVSASADMSNNLVHLCVIM